MSLKKNSIRLILGFCLISLVNNVEILDPGLDPALGEVVKNITKVNSLLQDLIKNYEKLKKMSEPEFMKSSYEDTEIHELFNDHHKKKRKKTSKPTNPTARTIRIYATAMEVSDDEKDKKHNGKSHEIHGVKIITASTKPKKRERKRNSKKKEKKHRPREGNSKKNVSKSGEETTLEKENNLEEKTKQSKELKGLPARLKKIAKKLFSDQLDKSEETTKSTNPSTTSISTDLMVEIRSYPEIVRPGIKTTVPIKEKKKDLEPRISRHGTDLEVKNNGQKERRHPIYIAENSQTSSQVITLPTYKKKLEPAIELSDFDSATIEESKVILNEELKTEVLRQAYGDACLKLVVRKCYMACKSVFKEVCRINHKCSPEFRLSFKKHAISGCDSYFQNNSVARGKYIEQDKNKKGFSDMTRDGYLSMACGRISFSQARPKSVRRVTVNRQSRFVEIIMNGLINSPTFRKEQIPKNKPNETSTEIQTVKPILRDKYEIACQQASRLKCYKACKHAATETCKEHKCSDKKKTALDKACKSHCKQNYGGKDSEDDSDSEETGSESEEKKEAEEEWR